jgi:hypothetical protein
MKELRLTDAKTGEEQSNFQIFTKGDFIIAGRAYGTLGGITYLGERDSDYPLRYRTGVFNLYTEEHERVEVTDFPVRLYAIRKTEETEMKGVERLKVMNRMKSCGKPPSEALLANNRYVIVMTSPLKTEAELIPQLYRFRRQMELVFKRLKSLFGYNRIPSKVDISVKAQVYGKLLLAAFCETRANKARFSSCPDKAAH